MRSALACLVCLTALLFGCNGQSVSKALVAGAPLCPLCSPRRIEIRFESASKLTEEAAIQATKQALISIGHSSPDMRPATLYPGVPNGQQGRYFHRPSPSSEAGILLWHVHRSDRSFWRIRVDVMRQGARVVCTVHRPTQTHSCMDGSWWTEDEP